MPYNLMQISHHASSREVRPAPYPVDTKIPTIMAPDVGRRSIWTAFADITECGVVTVRRAGGEHEMIPYHFLNILL